MIELSTSRDSFNRVRAWWVSGVMEEYDDELTDAVHAERLRRFPHYNKHNQYLSDPGRELLRLAVNGPSFASFHVDTEVNWALLYDLTASFRVVIPTMAENLVLVNNPTQVNISGMRYYFENDYFVKSEGITHVVGPGYVTVFASDAYLNANPEIAMKLAIMDDNASQITISTLDQTHAAVIGDLPLLIKQKKVMLIEPIFELSEMLIG